MIHKAIIVAAGYGSRFFPLTRVVPKELLPLGLRPALDWVLEELEEAGITDVLLLSSRRKRALEDWCDRDPELEAAFAGSPRAELLRPRQLRVQVIRQARMGGTGDALLAARPFVGDDPVVVAYPDDLFAGANPTRALIDAHQARGGEVLAARDLGDEDPSRYGVLALGEGEGEVRPVRGFVEKPAPGAAPSRWVSLGRYLYTPAFFAALAEDRAQRGAEPGEFTHVGALRARAAAGAVSAVEVGGRYDDTGEPRGYARSFVERWMEDPEFREWLVARVADERR